ncbi:MAG: TonB-dependent receptor family protein [Gemmatimonadales bacterium]
MRRVYRARGRVRIWGVLGMAAAYCWLPPGGYCQQTDSLKRPSSPPAHTLPPITVSVTRAELPLSKIPLAVHTIDRADISAGRPTWGLDEALFHVPGVFAANRYNFSLDQRISIRGFGSRSAFAIRGVKVLMDGIPQTLPDGQGQLTNVELGETDKIEVLRGAASSLFGNASGGVISIWTSPAVPERLTQEVRVVSGAFDRENRRGWTKWQSTSAFPLGRGSASVTVSRLDYEGERDHTEADLRNLNARLRVPWAPGWSLAVVAEVGDQPVANNPGALTEGELRGDRDSAARLNLLRRAGKDVLQVQGGATLKRQLPGSGEAALTVFGLRRDLTNPLPQAYITFDRWAYGVRASATQARTLAGRAGRLTAGFDLQWQRDDRRNFSYVTPITPATTTPDNRPDTLILSQVERVSEAGPFVQSLVELSPRVSLTAGLRYDRVSFRAEDRHLSDGADDSGVRRMGALSWSLGLAATPGDEGALTAYANVGTSFETPTTTELANRPTGAGGFNPVLDPQLATNLEVGARGRAGSGGEGGGARVDWSLALFQASVRDELVSFEVPDDSVFPGRRFFRNAGRARHRGVELGADIGLGPRVDVLVSWTYSDFRYTAYRVVTFDLAGKAIPGIPRNVLHLGLRARPAPLRGGWLHLDVAHTDAVSVDDTLGVTTGAWWVANARAGWDGSVGGLRLSPFVGLNNVLDAHYVGSVVINAARGRYYEPAPGRNLYIGFALGGSPPSPPLEPGARRLSLENSQRR